MGATHRLERYDRGSAHLFEVRVDGRQLTIREGTFGAGRIRQRTKRFLTARRAQLAADAMIDEKYRAGYRAVTDVAPPPGAFARDPELEAAIRANRADPAAYLVYADWLQQHGNPYGELIVLAHALATELDAAKRARQLALIDALRLPSTELARVEWRLGLWSKLELAVTFDSADVPFDAVALARRLFAETACCALERLAIGMLRWDHDHVDVPAVLAIAAEHAWARDLVDLAIGELGADIDMAHHVIGDVGASITRAFPNLRRLHLHSGEQPWHGVETFGLAGLDLPALETLVIETCSMSRERLGALLAGNLPAVTSLELWFGSTAYGATARCDDVVALLDGRAFPSVTKLGLRNAEFTDELARQIGSLPIAPRLVELDLSMGTLGDEAALALAARARNFERLRRLDVDDNFLTVRGLAALRSAFPNVVSAHQKLDEGFRYVSVGE